MTRRGLFAAAIAGSALLATASPAAAQAKGVKGGATLFTIVVSPPEDVGDLYGYGVGGVGGAFLTFRDASRLSFEVGGQFSFRRIPFADVINDTISYVEAPMVARYRIWNRPGLIFRAIGGGSANFRLTARESAGGDSSSATDAYEAFEFAVVAGAQAEWKAKWSVEGRFLFGLTNPFPVTIGGTRFRQQGVEILIGYRLR